MREAKTVAFTDEKGNRFIFPKFIRDGREDELSWWDVNSNALMLVSVVSRIRLTMEWIELDLDDFPHVITDVISPAFAHGAATGWLFAGPTFDEIAAEENNKKEETK